MFTKYVCMYAEIRREGRNGCPSNTIQCRSSYTLPRMKMISCGSEACCGLAVWPHGLLSSVTGEMRGLLELCFTDGSSRG